MDTSIFTAHCFHSGGGKDVFYNHYVPPCASIDTTNYILDIDLQVILVILLLLPILLIPQRLMYLIFINEIKKTIETKSYNMLQSQKNLLIKLKE